MKRTVGHPDPVLLVDGEVEWRCEGLAGLRAVALTDDLSVVPVALGEIQQLALGNSQYPYVAVGGSDDALHQTELTAEVDAIGRGQRLAVLVENHNRFASIRRKPDIALQVDGCTESAAFHAAAGKAGGNRRQRLAIGVELGGGALPQCVVGLPSGSEVVTDPEIAFVVEHRLAAGAVTAAIELERQYPRTGRELQVRCIRRRAQVLPLWHGIERIKQRKYALRLIPWVLRYRLRRGERVGRRLTRRAHRRSEELAACIRYDSCNATRKCIGQRREIRHRRRLAAVERILDRCAPAPGLEVDKARDIPGGDLQLQRLTFDRGAVDELVVRPHGRHGRHLIDRHIHWRLGAHYGDQRDSGIVSARLAGRRRPAFGNQVQRRVICGISSRDECEAAIGVSTRLTQLRGRARSCCPKRYR